MNNDNYYVKYQKYKLKYVNAKSKQNGGQRKYIPLEKLGDALYPPETNINTQFTDNKLYDQACLNAVPILCGKTTPQSGYCRRSDKDCTFVEFGKSEFSMPGETKPVYQNFKNVRPSELDAYGNPVYMYKPYVFLDQIENVIQSQSGLDASLVEKIKAEVAKIKKDLTNRPLTTEELQELEHAPIPKGSPNPLTAQDWPAFMPEAEAEAEAAPLRPTRAPPEPTSAPIAAAPTPVAAAPTPTTGSAAESKLRQEMLDLINPLESKIKKYENELSSLQSELNRTKLTSDKIAQKVNLLIPIVTQIVISYTALKNMNSRRGRFM
ncbi:MAG: hypothetical protein Hyperionvirus12_34 [Hyperionvirus sp.]|uniref:Uncharacterized protein n=1 Tax=Hyperionvirus sp. TaxID=2487770 RepID=A0A3G5A993_9VIRU|nr:MAG: hypothetical protein Hyperionvirus12_34 [Hyperionvirus sp.]